jgi:hypothetical protein
MSIKTVIKLAVRYIDDIPAREFKVAVFVCITIAALNALVFAFRIGYIFGNDACYAPMHHDNSYAFMRLKIEGALLVIAITLRFRRVVGLCIALLATVLIEVQYVLWYLDTQRWLRDMRLTDLSQATKSDPQFAGIYQARPWDIVLLVFATALLAWQVRVVILLITRNRRKQSA